MKLYRVTWQGARIDATFPDTPEGNALAGQWLAMVINFLRGDMGPGFGPVTIECSG